MTDATERVWPVIPPPPPLISRLAELKARNDASARAEGLSVSDTSIFTLSVVVVAAVAVVAATASLSAVCLASWAAHADSAAATGVHACPPTRTIGCDVAAVRRTEAEEDKDEDEDEEAKGDCRACWRLQSDCRAFK